METKKPAPRALALVRAIVTLYEGQAFALRTLSIQVDSHVKFFAALRRARVLC